MAKQNTPLKGGNYNNVSNRPSLDELRAIQKAKKDCAKRVEVLKYKLFQISEKHMVQAIIVIKGWIKS